MNLIALLIGLVIEHLATQLFHLRELRWLDRVIDSGFRQATRLTHWPALIPVILLALMLVLPVFIFIFSLGDALHGFAYLVLAIVVLFFSLGPKDIGENVVDYCKALEEADEERIQRTTKAIVESDVPDDPRERIHRVEQAVCVQANNRLFAVIFWFVLLGPLGAWTYRVTDLIRRRAVFNVSRVDDTSETTAQVRDASVMLHGWLAWIPARLTAIGYAIAGHFDGALAAWRNSGDKGVSSPSESSENLLARVGVGAMALEDGDDDDLAARGVRGATAAYQLVFRLLLIWAVAIATMTLYGWSV